MYFSTYFSLSSRNTSLKADVLSRNYDRIEFKLNITFCFSTAHVTSFYQTSVKKHRQIPVYWPEKKDINERNTNNFLNKCDDYDCVCESKVWNQARFQPTEATRGFPFLCF